MQSVRSAVASIDSIVAGTKKQSGEALISNDAAPAPLILDSSEDDE